jgi:hypothetical protein
MGEAIGESLCDDIAAMIERRWEAAASYCTLRGRGSVDDMIAAGWACLDLLHAWDPPGWEEHMATAGAASVDPGVLYAAANYSDVRDLVCHDPCEEGCTSMAIPGSAARDGAVLVGQTWDLHPLDVDSVLAVNRIPDSGPETWSVTIAGAPTLIGMNVHGVWTGTTNIKVRGGRPGIGYMSLLHRAIRCGDREEAAAVIQHAPRAAAHTYLLADAGGAVELECSATRTRRRDVIDQPIVRTNHCLDAEILASEAEPPSSSSVARLNRATELTSSAPLTVEGIRRIMSDRSDGVDSICRWQDDGEPTATNACVIGVPATRRFEACRGPADRGLWVPLSFSGGA